MPDGEKFRVKAGELDYVSAPHDAPTVYADGIRGVMVNKRVVKLSFYEQVVRIDGGVVGKHAINLAIPADQFLAVADHLAKIAADMRTDAELTPTEDAEKAEPAPTAENT